MKKDDCIFCKLAGGDIKTNALYEDDIVKVKNGYGRNYLIPYKKAVIASKSAKKVLEEKLKQRAHKLEKIKNDALARSIGGCYKGKPHRGDLRFCELTANIRSS